MKIVIAGAGEVGIHLAKLLSNENYVNKAPANIVEMDRKKLAEEKEKLATVRTSIRDEIAKVLASAKNKSVLETIQFLYNIDSKVEHQ